MRARRRPRTNNNNKSGGQVSYVPCYCMPRVRVNQRPTKTRKRAGVDVRPGPGARGSDGMCGMCSGAPARTSCARRVLRERLPGAAGTAYSPREDPVSARVRACAGIPSYGCVRMVRVRAMRGRETRCAAPGQHQQRYRAPGVRPSTSCLAVRAQRPSSTTTWTTDSLMR